MPVGRSAIPSEPMPRVIKPIAQSAPRGSGARRGATNAITSIATIDRSASIAPICP